MNFVLTLLYPEEWKLNFYKNISSYIVSWQVSEEIFFRLIPHMFHLTYLLTSSKYEKTSETSYILFKGWLATSYAADLVGIKVSTKVDWSIFPMIYLKNQNFQEMFWRDIENKMYEYMNQLKNLKEKGIENVIDQLKEAYKIYGQELPKDLEESLKNVVEHLYESFRLISRSIAPNGDINLEKCKKLRTCEQ